MYRGVFTDTRLYDSCMECFLKTLTCYWFDIRNTRKKQFSFEAIKFPIFAKRIQTGRRKQGVAILKIFALANKDLHVTTIDVAYMEIQCFT